VKGLLIRVKRSKCLLTAKELKLGDKKRMKEGITKDKTEAGLRRQLATGHFNCEQRGRVESQLQEQGGAESPLDSPVPCF
jgi:hypothetical protein